MDKNSKKGILDNCSFHVLCFFFLYCSFYNNCTNSSLNQYLHSFKEENAGDSATPPSLMVSGKLFPPKVASWDSKHMNHTPTMQPTNLTGVRGGPPPALPPKPTRNTGIGFPSGRVAPISEPVPLFSGSSTKPNVLLPPKSDQVLGMSTVNISVRHVL